MERKIVILANGTCPLTRKKAFITEVEQKNPDKKWVTTDGCYLSYMKINNFVAWSTNIDLRGTRDEILKRTPPQPAINEIISISREMLEVHRSKYPIWTLAKYSFSMKKECFMWLHHMIFNPEIFNSFIKAYINDSYCKSTFATMQYDALREVMPDDLIERLIKAAGISLAVPAFEFFIQMKPEQISALCMDHVDIKQLPQLPLDFMNGYEIKRLIAGAKMLAEEIGSY